jgi:hypothetical protein
VLVNIEADASIALLDAMHRVLRTGGGCVVSLFTVDRPEWRADQLARIRRGAPAGQFTISHPRTYFSSQVEEMLALVDFEVVDLRYDESVPSDDRAHCVVAAVARDRAAA